MMRKNRAPERTHAQYAIVLFSRKKENALKTGKRALGRTPDKMPARRVSALSGGSARARFLAPQYNTSGHLQPRHNQHKHRAELP
jgi:hypothetical protein